MTKIVDIATSGAPLQANDRFPIGRPGTGTAIYAKPGDITGRLMLDVKHYGAVGDGVTDDTTAIQAAISAGTGQIVWFSAGTYVISTPIDLGAAHGTILRGAGRKLSIIKNTSTTGGAAIHVGAIQSCQIEDLYILGNGASGCGAGILLNGNPFTHLILSNLYIDQCNRAIDTTGANGIDVVMMNVRCDSGNNGFYLVTANTINHVTAIDCYANATTGSGWKLSGIASAVLIDCDADNNTSLGYELDSGDIILIGCDAEANSNYGYIVNGAGTYTFLGCRTYNQTVPFEINAAAAVSLQNCVTAATPSANSVEVGAPATLATTFYDNTFDKVVYVNAAAVAIYRKSSRVTTTGTLESSVATGTAPLVVASATKVVNLNADQLDGLDSTYWGANTIIYQASGTQDLTNAYVDMAGVTTGTFTPTVNEVTIVEEVTRYNLSSGTAAAQVGDTIQSQIDLYYNSADHLQTPINYFQVPGVTLSTAMAAGHVSATTYHKLSLTAGTTYTIKLQVKNSSGARGRCEAETQMKVTRLPA